MAEGVEDAEVDLAGREQIVAIGSRYFRLKERIDWARDVRCQQNNLFPLTAPGSVSIPRNAEN